MAQPRFHEPKTPTFTAWRNPTNKTVRVDLHVSAEGEGGAMKHRYEWPPGETKHVNSDFDRGIQDVRDGVIMGGLAPQLVRVTEGEPPELHPALDVEGAKQREALAEAQQALVAKKVAEDALVVATAKAQAASEAKTTKR